MCYFEELHNIGSFSSVLLKWVDQGLISCDCMTSEMFWEPSGGSSLHFLYSVLIFLFLGTI